MAEEILERVPSAANADGMPQSLTQDVSLETTEHVKKPVMSLKGTSEEEDKAPSGMLSKLNKPDADEKPSVETEGKMAMAGGNHVMCNDDIEQSQCASSMSESCIQGKDVIESGAEKNNFDTDSNGQVDCENGFSGGTGKLPDDFKTTDDNCFDRSVNNELSDDAEKPSDEVPATWANPGNVSSSEDEKLPELLSIKAEDTCSEIDDGEGRESLGGLPAGMDANGESKSMEEMQGAFQGNSCTNLLSGWTETEKCYPPGKVVDYESSSEDDQMAPSSSHSEVTSSSSELSDVSASSETPAPQSGGVTSDLRNTEQLDNSSMSKTGTRVDDNALNAEAAQEPAEKRAHVLEQMSSVLSTGTQTSSGPDENLQQDQLAKDKILNTWNYEGLSSILTMKDNRSLKLPFYYQPQIVMHEQQPVLVLQPVRLSMSSPGNGGDVPSIGKGTVPIILPLASLEIDKRTKDAVLEQIDEDASEMSSTTSRGYVKYSLLQNDSSDVPPPLNTAQLGGFNDRGGETRSVGTDMPISRRLAEEEKLLERNKTDGLPEWVPSAELDKAFSAAAEGAVMSSTEPTATTLTFPRVSLPSTNPFARDLAAQHDGNSEVKVDDLSSLGLDKTLQQSLFGPPSSSSLSPGARPKQIKVNQEPAPVGNTANPFTPDLTPKKRGRRQDQSVNEHSTEVIVTADVHSSVSQSAEVSRPSHRSPRPRLSSESMVTLIETTYADTPPSSAELAPAPAAAGEPNEITQVKEEPKPLVGSKETQSNIKRNLKVRSTAVIDGSEKSDGWLNIELQSPYVIKIKPGKVAPFWIPDFACSNCTNCKIKFTVFLRKHHCRGCGKIFCNNCCSQLARFPYMDFKIGRVCPSCTEAIREVTQKKRSEQVPKQSNSQQRTRTAPGFPPSTSVPQLQQSMQGLVIPTSQAQLNSSAVLPSVPLQTNQGVQQYQHFAQQYQQLPTSSSAKGQNSVTAAVVQSQASQGLFMPAQPANQYMLIPAHAVKPSVPVVYMNPVVPSVQGGQVFVPAASFVPQQAPVMVMATQPSSTPYSPQAAAKAGSTLAGGGWKGTAPVENRTSSGTVSTFTVLPQQVGQSAVESVQRRQAGSVKQPTTAVNQTSNTVSNVSSNSLIPVEPSIPPLQSPGTGKAPVTYPNQTVSLPSSASSWLSFPPFVTTSAPLQTNPTGPLSTTSLPKSSPRLATSTAPHQTQTSPPSTSSFRQSTTPIVSTAIPNQQSLQAAVNSPTRDPEAQGTLHPRDTEGSFLFSEETDPKLKPPLRRAGRTITWRYRTQGKSKLQEQRKFLAKDLRDLPSGVTIQATQELLVHVKRMKLKEKNRELSVWCYRSEGLNKFNHLEVVVMLEARRKEDIFPEEVLRVYRGILHLASKLGNRFGHCNYLSSNDQFLDSPNDAGFIFVSSEVKPKPHGLREIQTPFLYGILVKRPELHAAMFTPSRLLLRLGYEMKSFPFPLWNLRDRRPVNMGNEREDRFYHTLFAMNKYLKNSVPEALVPGLYVVKEDNKVILQFPHSAQGVVLSLLDRLIKKENQTATVPLLSDIPPYVDSCKVVICNQRGGKYVESFGNVENVSVVGLGFLMLHLGVDASSPLSFGGELLDDGVLVFFSKTHTLKLRQSLEERTNCYFYLGDKFDIAHFELRWMQDANYHVTNLQPWQRIANPTDTATTTVAADTTAKEPGADFHPGLATIDIRYSGYGSEVELLKNVFDDHTKILKILEDNIRQACTEPLMKHENKMKPGERLELQLRVVLRPSYKKWSVGPSDLPTALIRSLQMALHTVKVPVVSEGELVMSFDVGVVKQ